MELYRGIVVDNNSPRKNGRVKVRIFELHGYEEYDTNNIPQNQKRQDNFTNDADLPWCEVMQPISYIGFHNTQGFDNNEKPKANIDGSGKKQDIQSQRNLSDKRSGFGTNVVLEIGTWVFCVLDHSNPNYPIVIGTIASDNEINEMSNPLNQVTETVSGHYFERDDNPGNERIKTHHRTGTDYEMQANGNISEFAANDKTLQVSNNEITHVDGNSTKYVKSNVTNTVDGNQIEHIKGNENNIIDGDKTEQIKGNEVIEVSGQRTENVKGGIVQQTKSSLIESGSLFKVTAGTIILN